MNVVGAVSSSLVATKYFIKSYNYVHLVSNLLVWQSGVARPEREAQGSGDNQSQGRASW